MDNTTSPTVAPKSFAHPMGLSSTDLLCSLLGSSCPPPFPPLPPPSPHAATGLITQLTHGSRGSQVTVLQCTWRQSRCRGCLELVQSAILDRVDSLFARALGGHSGTLAKCGKRLSHHPSLPQRWDVGANSLHLDSTLLATGNSEWLLTR